MSTIESRYKNYSHNSLSDEIIVPSKIPKKTASAPSINASQVIHLPQEPPLVVYPLRKKETKSPFIMVVALVMCCSAIGFVASKSNVAVSHTPSFAESYNSGYESAIRTLKTNITADGVVKKDSLLVLDKQIVNAGHFYHE